MRWPNSLSPLAERNFRRLWIGQAVSAAGDSLTPVALAFAALQIAHSATALGIVFATSTVASAIALPVGGVWADRLPRQLVMLAADGVRAVVQAFIGILLITGHLQLWELIGGAFVANAASGFFMPASGALTPQTVSAERLQQANALMGLSRSATSVAGPAVSGILVTLAGPGWVFIVDAASFIVSAVSLALVHVGRVDGKPGANFLADLAEGLRAVTTRRWYLLNLVAHATWNFAIASFFVLGPIVAKEKLGGASVWGLIGTSMGVGAIAGGLLALHVRPKRPLIAANLMLMPAVLQLLALAIPLPAIGVMAACAVGWMGLTFLNEVWFATIPQLIPAEVLARATSFDWLLSIVAMPIGFAVSGPVADHIGARATLVGAAIVMAGCGLVVLIPGVRRVIRTQEGTIALEGAL